MNGQIKFRHIKEFALCEGDLSYVNLGTINNGSITPVILKVSKNEYDNDLLTNEADVIKDLNAKFAVERKSDSYKLCIPKLFDTFQVDAHDAPKPQVNVLEYYPGFFDVESIRKLTIGVDGRTLVWMWKRLMGVLSWVHHFRYVHGAVLPPHVMYFPDLYCPDETTRIKDGRTHSVRLVDWCYAVNTRKKKNLRHGFQIIKIFMRLKFSRRRT